MRSSMSDRVLDGADRLFAFRMERRQQLLFRSHPVRYHAVIDEAALRRMRGGGAVMVAQQRVRGGRSGCGAWGCADSTDPAGPVLLLSLRLFGESSVAREGRLGSPSG